MSTLKADTIVASDGSSPVTLTKQSAAKGYLLFDQRGDVLGVNTAGDTLNVTSITDVSTAIIQPNLTNSMNSTQFAPVTSGHWDGQGGGSTISSRMVAPTDFTASSFKISSQYANGSYNDSYFQAAIHGDLA